MTQNTEQATFGAGCFWHVEHAFRQVRGVTHTSVGYSGGHVQNPNYRMVCTGETGHAEVVRVQYDPNVVSYEELLNVFWQEHDPTSLNRQGPDVGTQYRSAIFYHSPEQERIARETVDRLNQSGKYSAPIVTEIAEAGPYYLAEDYHQQYFDKRRRFMGANREQGF